MSGNNGSRWDTATGLREALPPGSRISDAIVVDWEGQAHRPRLIFDWRKNRCRFGLDIETRPGVGRGFGTGSSLLDDLLIDLATELDVGLTANCARHLEGDVVVLDPWSRWLFDSRFDLLVIGAGPEASTLPVGVDIGADELARVTAVDARKRFVVTAVVEKDTSGAAALRMLYDQPAPEANTQAVALDAAHLAAHIAADAGILQLTSTTPLRNATVLGFSENAAGNWVAEADLLDEDVSWTHGRRL